MRNVKKIKNPLAAFEARTENILIHLTKFPPRKVILRFGEIRNAPNFSFGFECNRQEWKNFTAFLRNSKEPRNGQVVYEFDFDTNKTRRGEGAKGHLKRYSLKYVKSLEKEIINAKDVVEKELLEIKLDSYREPLPAHMKRRLRHSARIEQRTGVATHVYLSKRGARFFMNNELFCEMREICLCCSGRKWISKIDP